MTDSEYISATCFVPIQKSLIENATMAKMYFHAYIYMHDNIHWVQLN
jgi:hypothetical protein